jgi:hypothetical protein
MTFSETTSDADDAAPTRSRIAVVSRLGKSGLWAPCLSALCFIHCVGMALVTAWVPALALTSHAERLEWLLFALSVGSACWMLRRTRARLPWWSLMILAAGLVLWGLMAERERAQQIGFLALASIQSLLVLSVRRRAAIPACCDQEGGACAEAARHSSE